MKLLVVVDMQNDFIDGPLGTDEAKQIVPYVREKLNQYIELNYPIMYTQDTHSTEYLHTYEGKKLPVPHCIAGTEGHKIHKDLYEPKYLRVPKYTFGAQYLKWTIDNHIYDGVDTIEVCGICTDICVVTNVLLLRTWFPDMKIVVDAQCCAGTTPAKHEAALDVMESCQIDIINID